MPKERVFDLTPGLADRLASQQGRIPTTNFSWGPSELIHRGWVMEFHQLTVFDSSGQSFTRDIIRHPGAVSVLAVDGEDRVCLVQQYRAPVDSELIELPAGIRDIDGEPPKQTAARELMEEAGLKAGSIELLTTFHAAAGFCDEYHTVFLATDLEPVPMERHGPEEAFMEVMMVDFDEVVKMCLDGRITDAKTKIAVLTLLARRTTGSAGPGSL